MYVLGTAGHIDHGKSVLVKALTGIDPDRLREEKERGMTIELGFAWFRLPSGREVGIVDVPGHERFIKNMLAGVGGIDLALFIVAANEGVMPQTREHLAILDLIGVRRGIVVITKQDLVDADILALVRMEVEELVKDTVLSESPIINVSAITGEGMPELVSAIDAMLNQIEPRTDLGHPRLPIDRVFTMAGAGTVVTGTLIDGSLTVGQEVEIVPSGLKSRLRGLQTHKSRVDTATPGSRVAANLVGVNIGQLARGDVVTIPGWLRPAHLVTVKLSLIGYLQRPLRHGATVSFHTLAAETMARVHLLEADELKPGGSTWAQLSLRSPMAAINGDRFIIRSPMETLGGGGIVEAQARKLRRFKPEVIENLKARESGTSEEVILALLEARQPLEQVSLIALSNLPVDNVGLTIEKMVKDGKIMAAGEDERRLLFTAAGWARLSARVTATLDEYHRKFPARVGMPKAELGSRLKLGNSMGVVLADFTARGIIIEEGGNLRLPGHAVRLTLVQQAKIDAFLKSLAEHPYSPSGEIIPEPDLVNLLVSQGKVVKVSDSVVFSAVAYREMVDRVTARIKANGRVSLGEVRDMLATSRKYAQALLEHLDGARVTRRVDDDRVLY